MTFTIANKTYFQKAGELLFIMALLFSGLYLYDSMKYRIESFEWYHVNSYIDGFKNRDLVQNRDSAIASAAVAVPVLVYHGILSDDEFEAGDENVRYVNTSYSRFREQMIALKKDGWETITFSEFKKFIAGNYALPEKVFLLTFDDARKDSFYPTDPLLRSLSYEAILFVITGHSLGIDNGKSTYYLSEDELKQITNTGRWEVQSHGKNDHDYIVINANGTKGAFMSNKMWNFNEQRNETDEEFSRRISQDLKDARRELEQSFKGEISGYAFPFNDFGLNNGNFPDWKSKILETTQEVYDEIFYQASYADQDIFNYPGSNGLIKRVKGDASLSGDQLVNLFDESKPKSLPFKVSINESSWKENWGNVNLNGNLLSVGASSGSTTAYTTLKGTSLWTDYVLDVEVANKIGETFTVASFINGSNNYSCTISDSYIKLQRTTDGEIETLSDYKLQELNRESFSVSIGKNKDEEFSCKVGKYIYVSSGVKLNPGTSGQVGFKVWDKESGKATVNIKSVTARKGEIDSSESVLVDAQSIVSQKNRSNPSSFPIPYNWTSGSRDNWERNWGDIEQTNNGLLIQAPFDATGAFAVLPGSESWKSNFDLLFSLIWEAGSNVVFVYRYQDEKNYAAININDNYVRVEEITNGKTKVIEEKRRNLSNPEDNGFFVKSLKTKISLTESKVTFWMNGKKLLSVNQDKLVDQKGMVGIKVWDKNTGKSRVVVESLSVESR